MLYLYISLVRGIVLASCYQKRRECLASKLNIVDDIFVIESAQLKHRNGDVNYSYRQNSNFFYLTGFDENNALLMLVKVKGRLQTILFCQEKNYDYELWHGAVMGPKEARLKLNITSAYSINKFTDVFSEYINKNTGIHFLGNEQKTLQDCLVKIIQKKYPHHIPKFYDSSNILNNMRILKDKTEISLLERAADISCHAHKYAMSYTRPDILESYIEGKMIAKFMEYGCRQVAYESIVAGGGNACILHYTKNNKILNNGDLLLIDAGAEYENYASDITRTFPINGRFTQEQASIYQIVLEAQREVIAAAKPKVEWSKLQFISEITIIKGLIRLGILSGNPNNVLRQGQHKRFYMHGFGHWLGLDVHDVGSYKNNDGSSKLLEPGMVFTVEPGIYISEANRSVAAKWHNIGIRIEDNILITEKGCKVLTDSLPKDINDLRQIIGSAYA